jgi:hypothetical protein
MNDLFTYFEKLELVAFFSGFPLLYLIARYSLQVFNKTAINGLKAIVDKLPKAYALTSLLYVGMKINQSLPLTALNFNFLSAFLYYKCWAFLGLIFFHPYFSKKPFYSFFHSLVFIGLVIFDFISYYRQQIGIEVIHNEMRLYFLSLLLNLCTLTIILLYSFFANKISKNK